jgi:hypothetical protein
MTIPRIILIIAVLGTISGLILVLLERFFPQSSILGSAGSLVYFIGGVLVFLAFLKSHLSSKSRPDTELRTQNTEEADPDLNVEEVRRRVRAIKLERSRSAGRQH